MRALAAAASAILFALAYSVESAAPLGWACLAPVAVALRGARACHAALLGAGFAFAAVAGSLAWLPRVLVDLDVRTDFALALWASAGLCAIPAGACFGLGVARLDVRRGYYALAVGALWAVVEASWGLGLPGVPWIILGATYTGTALASVVQLGGVYAGSAALATVGAGLAQLAMRAPARAVWPGLALVGSVALLPQGNQGESRFSIAGVQPGLAMSERARDDFETRNLDVLLAESARLSDVDLIVWPEGALLSPPAERPDLFERVRRFVEAHDVAVVAGGLRAGRIVAWRFAPGLAPRVAHEKAQLVPLAESVPAGLPGFVRRGLGRLLPPAGFEPGAGERSPLPAGIGVAICWEAIFPAAHARARARVQIANDGWFDATPGALQHLRLARIRALEDGIPLLRVTATGTSAVFDTNGARLGALSVGARGVLRMRIRGRRARPRRTPSCSRFRPGRASASFPRRTRARPQVRSLRPRLRSPGTRA